MNGEQQHLEFIQNIISRMNINSFKIKELTVTLVTASIALYDKKILLILFVPVIPTILLWGLDSYYLQQERKFRGIYDDVITKSRLKNINEVKLYEIPIDKYTTDKSKTFGFINTLISKTLILFYLPLIILPFFFILLQNINIIFYLPLNNWIL